MSRSRPQSRSLFTCLRELIFGRAKTTMRRRALRLESLETRRVLDAELGSIVGSVFHDLDSNGARNGAEVGVAGLRVQLYRDNGSGAFEAAVDTLVTSTLTDSAGRYDFDNLSSGSYFVRRPAQKLTTGPLSGKRFTEGISGSVNPSPLKTVIDNFDTPDSQTAAVDTSNDGVPGTSVVGNQLSSNTIGGEREIITNFTGASTGPGILMSARVATINVNNGPMGLLLLDATSSAKGVYTLVWDGADGTASTSPDTSNGLGDIDLTAHGADRLKIKLNSLDLPGASIRATVYTDATHFSTASLPLQARVIDGVASNGGQTDYAFRFDGTGNGGFSLGNGASGNADFSRVEAVTLTIDAQANDIDARLETFGAYGSAVTTVDLPIDLVDVSIAKDVSTTTPVVGSVVTYTITVSNAASLAGGKPTVAATGVVVEDGIFSDPVNSQKLTYVGHTGVGQFAPGTGVWTVGTLSPGQSRTLQIRMRVNDSARPSVTNIARVTTVEQIDIDTNDWTASREIAPKFIDIGLAKTVSNARPDHDANIRFTLTARNNGTAEARNVRVEDLLDTAALADFDVATITAANGTSYSRSTGVWLIPVLPAGASVTLVVAGIMAGCDPVTNSASLLTIGNGTDTNPNNNSASSTAVPKETDIGIAKEIVGANSLTNANRNLVYRLTVTNDGPDNATGVEVTDKLPASLSFVSASSGSYNAATGVWNVGALANGASKTLVITARLADGAFPAQITNTATLTGVNQCDENSTNDAATITTDPQLIDLSVTKTVDRPSVIVGENVTWTMTVRNDGPDNATGVSLKDVLPPGVTYVGFTASKGSFAAGTGIWTVGSLATLESATLTITSRVDVTSPQTNVIEVFTADQIDIDSTPNNNAIEDDRASAVVGAIDPVIDLAVTKTVDRSSVLIGENVLWTMTVKNEGTHTATSVSLKDVLPSGVTLLSTSVAKGTYEAATGIWNVGTLIPTEIVALTLYTRVNVTAPQTNVIEVFTADQRDIDSTPNNNAVEDDRASAVVDADEPVIDLAVTKTVDRQNPNVNENVLWTMTVKNEGAHTATSVSLKDVLPSGVTLLSTSVAKGAYDAATGIWNVGTLIPTEIVALTLFTRVNVTAPQTNLIEVFTADQRDIDSTPNNNAAEDDRASASVIALPIPVQESLIDLEVSKTVDRQVPAVGETVLFTMIVSNTGPSNATGVSLIDRLPSGLTYVSSSVAKGSFNPSTGIWNVGQLVRQERVALTITARVDVATPLTNVIEIYSADQRDIDSTPNNSLVEDDRASASIFPLAPTQQGDPDPPITNAFYYKRRFISA